MIGVHAVHDVRAAEAALMAHLPDGALMQRAAAGLSAECARLLGRTYGARVALLVGGGDNGGDALYAGARLAQRGARVDAILAKPERAHAGGMAALSAAGGRAAARRDGSDGRANSRRAAEGRDDPARVIARADLIIDGLLGIGGRGGLRGEAADLADQTHDAEGLVVAVDLPSGVDPDTGETPGPHVKADLTVTFGTRKIALAIDPGAAAAGRIVDIDIGLGPYLPTPTMEVLARADIAALLPTPSRHSDKYRRGVVGVLAGSAQFSGAAVLTIGGAIRGGAGMVRYAGLASEVVRARWPEAVAAPGRVQSWVVGPGLGDDEAHGPEVAKILAEGVPVVVDADGLRYLPLRFETPALLTPHAGELARMLGEDRADVEARRLNHAVTAARRWNAVVLLKGSTTLVATPDGRVRVNPTGTPALATAGSGDVLAGLAGALLAAGLEPLDAGSVAAYVHGMAGPRAARSAAYPSATDILDALPAALRS